MSIETIQIIAFVVLFLLLILAFILIDDWLMRRRTRKNIKKWKDEVERSDKKNYRRKSN